MVNFINNILSLVRELRWSYLPKSELVKSEALKNLENLAEELSVCLDEKGREFREKDPLFFYELKFVSHTISSLRDRISNLPDKQISAVSVVYVNVIDIEKYPRGENLFVTYVTDGSRNYRVVTNDSTIKSGDICPLAILPPREFMGIVSEGMFVGGAGGIRKFKDESLIGKWVELLEDEEKSVVNEIFVFLKQ